jgi:hypothetical protein
MPNAGEPMTRPCAFLVLVAVLLLSSGCDRPRWDRADLFSTTEAARSASVIDATVENVAFLGGVQRGLNLKLDQPVETDQGRTRYLYLEQPVQLRTGVTFMRRVRVHFDHGGSPLFVEEIKPATP